MNKTNACLCHEAPLASCAPARGPGVGALAGQGLSGTPLLLGRKRDGPGSRGEASRSHPPGGQGGSPLNLEVGTPRTVSPAGLHPCFSAWTSGDLHSPGATFSFSVRPSGLIRAKQPTVRAWQGAELPVQVLIFLDLQSCGTVGSQGAVLGQVHEDLAVPGTHTHTHTHTHTAPPCPHVQPLPGGVLGFGSCPYPPRTFVGTRLSGTPKVRCPRGLGRGSRNRKRWQPWAPQRPACRTRPVIPLTGRPSPHLAALSLATMELGWRRDLLMLSGPGFRWVRASGTRGGAASEAEWAARWQSLPL